MTFENYTMYSIKTPQTNMCLYLWEISKSHKDGNATRDILSKTWGYDTTHCQRKQQSGYVYSKTNAQYLMTTTQIKKKIHSLTFNCRWFCSLIKRYVCTCSQNIAWTRQWSVIQHHHKPSIFYTSPFVKSCADITMHYRVLTYIRVNSGEGCVWPSAISF
jgi:hypothetical protein